MIRRGISGMKVIAVLVAAMLALTGASAAFADHGKDDRGSRTDDHHAFGAWLYEGSCDALASAPLNDIGDLEQESDADDIARLQLPTPTPSPVWMEDEDISMTVADLVATPHAVVVRASGDPAAETIACGDVGQGDAPTGAFSITLHTVGESGYTGSVRFEQESDDSGPELDIIVGLWEGTSVATPTA